MPTVLTNTLPAGCSESKHMQITPLHRTTLMINNQHTGDLAGGWHCYLLDCTTADTLEGEQQCQYASAVGGSMRAIVSVATTYLPKGGSMKLNLCFDVQTPFQVRRLMHWAQRTVCLTPHTLCEHPRACSIKGTRRLLQRMPAADEMHPAYKGDSGPLGSQLWQVSAHRSAPQSLMRSSAS